MNLLNNLEITQKISKKYLKKGKISRKSDNFRNKALKNPVFLTNFVSPISSHLPAPSEPPTNLEALLLNATAISLKWQSPPDNGVNGVLMFYQIIIRSFDAMNISRILANMSVEAASPQLLLANLTTGVTYSVSIAAATRIGIGVYSKPAILRLDPHTKKLDQEYTR